MKDTSQVLITNHHRDHSVCGYSLVEDDGRGDHKGEETEDDRILTSNILKHIEPQTPPHTPQNRGRL